MANGFTELSWKAWKEELLVSEWESIEPGIYIDK